MNVFQKQHALEGYQNANLNEANRFNVFCPGSTLYNLSCFSVSPKPKPLCVFDILPEPLEIQ